MKYPPGALLSLVTEQYIRRQAALSLSAFLFSFPYFCPNGGFWPPHLHRSGSSGGKTNKTPSKSLPKACVQMWSTVWWLKRCSIQSFLFSCEEILWAPAAAELLCRNFFVPVCYRLTDALLILVVNSGEWMLFDCLLRFHSLNSFSILIQTFSSRICHFRNWEKKKKTISAALHLALTQQQ